jgi:phytoene dehydrogenase-like protein
VTASALDADRPGSGERYLALLDSWTAIESRFMGALLGPFPPLRSGLGLLRTAGVGGALDLGRRALLPLRRFLTEELDGESAGLLFAGSALHADLGPEMPGSGLFGWILTCLGQRHGFPVPEGGAQSLTDALVRRLHGLGATVHCNARVARVKIERGRAVGVVLADGTPIGADRAVVADCDATALFTDLVGLEHLPNLVRARLSRIERGWSTLKIDWALSSRIPWIDPAVKGAGTVHIASSVDELTMSSAQIACGLIPSEPFVVMGQMSTADASRSPIGTESAWAYTHAPQHVSGDAGGEGITGTWDATDVAKFVDRVETRIERLAPGFRDRIIASHVRSPRRFDEENPNLVGGDINGGTAQLHQQLIFRPIAGTGRPATPIGRLYLGSSSAHPGGGVHGACGANAARAAILGDRVRKVLPFR